MKRKFTFLMAAFMLLAFLAVPLGMRGQTRAEELVYTLEPTSGTNSSYAGNCNITISGITWNLTGNSQQIPWRIGGNSISEVDRTLYSKTALNKNISKIEVTHGTANSITVNSWTIQVASDADFNTIVSTLTPNFTANTTTTIERPSGVDWSNCYFKFIYNVTVSGTSNKFVQFTRAKFYEDASGPVQLAAPALSPVSGNEKVTLSWEAIDNASSYTVKYADNSSFTGATEIPNASSPLEINNLTNGTQYYFCAKTIGDGTNYLSSDYGTSVSATPSNNVWALVTSASDLVDGDLYVIACNSSGKVAGNISNSVMGSLSASFSSDYSTITTLPSDVVQLTLGINGSNYTFANSEDQLLGCTEVKKLAWGNGTTTWELTFTGSDLTMSSTGSGFGDMKYNSSSPRFTTYASGQTDIQLYRYTTASTAVTTTTTINVPSGFNTDLNNGTSAGTLTATVSAGGNPIDGASVIWASSNTSVATIGETTGVVTLVAAGTTNITASYAGVENVYKPSSGTYALNVTNSAPLANIAALTAQTTDGSYTVSLTDALVTYVNGTNAYLEDAYGAVLLYHCADGLAVGDKITGTADVTYTIFNNLPEVTAYTLSTGHTLTHNNTVTPTEITISALESNFTNYISRYVKIVDATVTSAFSNRNCTIEQSGSSIVLRDQNNPGTLTTTVNDVVTVTAHPSIFNSTHQIAVYEQSQIVVTPSTTPSITLNTYTVDVDAAAHEEYLTITVGNIVGYDDSSFEVYFYESDGVTSADYSSWFDATVIDNPSGDGYVVYCAIQSNDAAERHAYMKVYILGNDFNEATSNLITITQAAPVLDYATLPFNWAGGTKSELNTQNGVTVTAADDDYAAQNAPYRVKFNNDGYNIVIKTNEQPAAVSVGIKKFGSGNASTLVIEGSVDGISYFEVETFAITGAQNNTFTYYTTNAFNANYRYVRIYFNKPSSGGANIGVGPITIRGIETYNKSITGYGNSAGGYVLLASPIKDANPVEVGMITDQLGATANSGNSTYDLYWFDQTAGAAQAWRNYRQETFNLAAGKGYLYASKNGVNLTFTGTPNLYGTVTLVKNNVAGDLEGWNLVGNPFGENAYIDRNFYAMNPAGTDVIQTSGAIAPMQGVFVVAASDGESLTFSTTAPSSNNNNNGIAMNLSQTFSTRGDSHENVIDRAMVRFGEGDNLPKFQINPSNTKLYIPQNGKDYAVIRSEARGEMPVNFKAAETGTYTISVETENLDVNYLHLIDNMTGMDVDLLATPSYTFEGKKSDYASRFKLVFSANADNNETNEDFAFVSDGNIIILNEGEATLQVIDIMGRVISTQTVNGNASVNNVGAAGVYVLQLINGNNVKTQKIVVR